MITYWLVGSYKTLCNCCLHCLNALTSFPIYYPVSYCTLREVVLSLTPTLHTAGSGSVPHSHTAHCGKWFCPSLPHCTLREVVLSLTPTLHTAGSGSVPHSHTAHCGKWFCPSLPHCTLREVVLSLTPTLHTARSGSVPHSHTSCMFPHHLNVISSVWYCSYVGKTRLARKERSYDSLLRVFHVR